MHLELLDQYVASAMQDDQGGGAEEAEDIVYQMRLAYPHHRGAAFVPPDALLRGSVGWVNQQQQAR